MRTKIAVDEKSEAQVEAKTTHHQAALGSRVADHAAGNITQAEYEHRVLERK